MKKICLLLAIPLLLQSCLKHQEDLFSENASERMDQTLRNVNEVLRSASNGWVMEYYPANTTTTTSQQLGGFTMLLKFSGDTVTIASNYGLDQIDSTASSLYAVIAETGPVLTFHTFNPLMHYFSNAQNPDRINITQNTGMQGDYEFIILNTTSDVITLKGKRTGNMMTIRCLQDNLTWNDYLAKIRELEQKMLFIPSSYIYTSGTNTAIVTPGNADVTNAGKTRRFTFTYDSASIEKSISVAFVSDLKGVVFYRPIVLFGQTITRMDFSVADSLFTVPGQSGKMVPVYLTFAEQLMFGKWYFRHSDIGPTGYPAWTVFRDHITTTTFNWMYLGLTGPTTATSHGYSLYLNYTNATPTTYNAAWPYTLTILGFSRVSLAVTTLPIPSTNGNASYNRNGAGVVTALGGLGAPKIYEITSTDDGVSMLKLQDINDPNNWYILTKTLSLPF
jgi:hypothetical protein